MALGMGAPKRDSVQVVHLVEMAAARLTGRERSQAKDLAKFLHEAVLEEGAQLTKHSRTRIGRWAEKVIGGERADLRIRPSFVRKVRCGKCRREVTEDVSSRRGRSLGPALYCRNCHPTIAPHTRGSPYRGGDSMDGFKQEATTAGAVFGLAALATLAFVFFPRKPGA